MDEDIISLPNRNTAGLDIGMHGKPISDVIMGTRPHIPDNDVV